MSCMENTTKKSLSIWPRHLQSNFIAKLFLQSFQCFLTVKKNIFPGPYKDILNVTGEFPQVRAQISPALRPLPYHGIGPLSPPPAMPGLLLGWPFPKAATTTPALPRSQGPNLHQCVGALKLSHHSYDKVLHLLKVPLVNTSRAINQEDNVHLLTWTLCREGGRNQRC